MPKSLRIIIIFAVALAAGLAGILLAGEISLRKTVKMDAPSFEGVPLAKGPVKDSSENQVPMFEGVPVTDENPVKDSDEDESDRHPLADYTAEDFGSTPVRAYPSNRSTERMIAEYYPTAPMSLEYSGGYEAGGERHRVDRRGDLLVHYIENGGTHFVRLKTIEKDRVYFNWHWDEMDLEEHGFDSLNVYFDQYKPANDVFLQGGKATVGASWSNRIGNEAIECTIMRTGLTVWVEAGRFDDVIEVACEWGEGYAPKSYYAPGVGLIDEDLKYHPRELIKLQYNLQYDALAPKVMTDLSPDRSMSKTYSNGFEGEQWGHVITRDGKYWARSLRSTGAGGTFVYEDKDSAVIEKLALREDSAADLEGDIWVQAKQEQGVVLRSGQISIGAAFDRDARDDVGECQISALGLTVTVPAGEFYNVVQTICETSNYGGYHYYYAPGIGMIKSEAFGGYGESVSELLRLEYAD